MKEGIFAMKKGIIGLMLVVALLFGSSVGIVEANEAKKEPQIFTSKSVINGKVVEEKYMIDENGKITSYNEAEIVVFQGYGKNVDYSEPELFLKEGTQMVATDRVKEVAKRINDKKDFTTLRDIWREVRKVPYSGKVPKFSATADEILKNGHDKSCGHNATVFTALARYKGIPTVYIYAIDTDYINGKTQNAISGHVFVEVYINEKWYLVDPSTGRLYLDYDVNNLNYYIYNNPTEYYLFSKSLDYAEADLASFNKAVYTQPREYFRESNEFKWEGYTKPNYKFIDIREGQ